MAVELPSTFSAGPLIYIPPGDNKRRRTTATNTPNEKYFFHDEKTAHTVPSAHSNCLSVKSHKKRGNNPLERDYLQK